MKVGEKIRKYRRGKDKTQETLAEDVGVTASFISRIENNQSDVDTETLTKIAKALDVSPVVFFEDFDAPVPQQNIKEKELATNKTSKPIIHFKMTGFLTEDEQDKIQKMIDELSKTAPNKRETAIQVVDTILRGS